MNEVIRKRLIKIQELAKRGSDGEKEVAARMLNDLLTRHNLKLEDLSDDRVYYEFVYKLAYERRILFQIYAKVTGNNQISYKRTNKTIFFKLTKKEYEQIKEMFPRYRAAFKKDLDDLMVAFVQKHKLSSGTISSVDDDIDWDYLNRIINMAENLNNAPASKERRLKS